MKQTMPKHIIIKLFRNSDKEEILKAGTEKIHMTGSKKEKKNDCKFLFAGNTNENEMEK